MQEPDEHQPVEDDRGVPAAVPLVVDALDGIEQRLMLFLIAREEALGGLLHVQRGGHAAGDFQHRDTAGFVQFGKLYHHGVQLGGEQVHRLATEILVAAGGDPGLPGFGILAALDPVPEALAGRVLTLGEDQQIFMMALADMPPDRHALSFIRPALLDDDLQHRHAGQLRHHAL
ncbi:MAG: hypothetical protein ACYC5U_12470 [Rhodocyclaceae bacterium]